MEYDSASSFEGRLKDLETPDNLPVAGSSQDRGREAELPHSSAVEWYSAQTQNRANLPEVTKRTLSTQVMEYYHKYSQNSSLGRYFSLADNVATTDTGNYCRRACVNVDLGKSRDSYVILSSEERSRLDSSVPRERRRWARPPLIGQPSETQTVSSYVGASSADSRSPSPVSKRPATSTIPEERNESREALADTRESENVKATSPTSSVASHKPLEWDSGADVGYYNALPRCKEKDKKLCTIERMALARGCSAALRLDPEGTNESSSSRKSQKNSMKPDANSTPLVGVHVSGESESEIEITPIVKNHQPGIIAGNEFQTAEVCCKAGKSREQETPKIKKNSAACPPIKYPTEGSRSGKSHERETSPLKKSSSMNLLELPLSKLSLKRSQSELNLRGREKKNAHPLPPLIFDSTSSIATVVNKPATLDKFIQTSLDTFSQGIQVSLIEVDRNLKSQETKQIDNEENSADKNEQEQESERKPPLPKRASSLVPKSLHSILKNSNTYDVRDRSRNRAQSNSELSDNSTRSKNQREKKNNSRENDIEAGTSSRKTDTNSSSEVSRESSTSAPEVAAAETTGENATGRASNSFEYFPAHIYQNVAAGSTSHVSSVDTGRESRCSTMPNTSSSIDEKLWGDSDNLVRDLERSVNILKSLVDANKCDKQVKKRLIHHVIKRLVTAKYTDDRIDRDLDENVPWNPADARKKIYRNEIIQALAQKHNTTDSSAEDWRPRKRNIRASSSSPKKVSKEIRSMKDIIDLATSQASTENSDKFPFDCQTDRTVMDGRKARMGLRSEDRRREAQAERDKSESSECFVPSSHAPANYKIDTANIFYNVDKPGGKLPQNSEPIATTTTNSGATSNRNQLTDRIVLVKNRTRTESNETDWRLPTTMSERRFEMGRRSNSESGDAKLINYAEMEKRNQLVWITNEISHLCNLKRLLEESNKSEAGPSRAANSPRKNFTNPPIGQWILGGESSPDNERLPREKATKKIDENQWSSHGNLARGRADSRIGDRVGHTRKRNSCTQTGSDGGPSGHSRTGGEIVSATIPLLISASTSRANREEIAATRDASVQTISNPIQCQNRIETSAGEKINHQTQRHVCYCQRYAAHSRHAACIVHSPARCLKHEKNVPISSHKREDRPIITQPTVQATAKTIDSRKEAKNQLNANCKSKWAIRELPAGAKKNRCEKCEGHSGDNSKPEKGSKIVAASSRKLQNGVIEICECSSDCNCDVRQRRKILTDTSSEKETEEIESPECCATTSAAEDVKCTCEIDDHSRRKKNVKNSDEEDARTTSSVEIKTDEKSCKSCRTCGTVWKIREGKNANRRCKCSQDYLKPVAYELKFDEAKEPKERAKTSRVENGARGKTKYDRNEMRGLNVVVDKINNQPRESQSLPTSARNRNKCACDEAEGAAEEIEKETQEDIQDEDEQPGTLQDFLATNKPEFVDNVETRRRYMTEISQLRQLKKEKRKQFLAMAGTSAFIKSPRSAKGPTANAQKKISEYEMKLRLRMRYLRLNEVRNKRRQREKEEEARRNHLMAKLFGQKLQQKVLRGQVDLSQSVSVISNL